MILEHEPRKIAINPDRFDNLITALRTAVDDDGTLSYNVDVIFTKFIESLGELFFTSPTI
jgi:hypothetical protein